MPDRAAVSDRVAGPAQPPPLSLYLHFPWCLRRCPYCDFNAHQRAGSLPLQDWLRRIAEEADSYARLIAGRKLRTVFFGGGTPSLMPPDTVAEALALCDKKLWLAPNAEITLEANPGALEMAASSGYLRAGVNRLSLGVQSFQADSLRALGRIHGPAEALAAVKEAQQAGLRNINVDLMYGLPGQTVPQALDDLRQAIDLQVPHISWYQLTIEPNTPFWSQQPELPDEQAVQRMEAEGRALLRQAGLVRYEISAWAKPDSARAKPDSACAHNLNYWTFGDYLGLGPGAHSKITSPDQGVWRWTHLRTPEAWLASAPARVQQRCLSVPELRFEFALNAFRLLPASGESLCQARLLRQRTGLQPAQLEPELSALRRQGLMHSSRLCPTERGYRYLNDLTAAFLPDSPARSFAGRPAERGVQTLSVDEVE